MPTCFENYLPTSTNHFMNQGSSWFGRVESSLRCVEHTARFTSNISSLAGDRGTAEKCNAVANGFGDVRGPLNSLRFIFPLLKFITGQMVLQTEEKSKRIIGFKLDENKKYVFRDWMDITSDFCVLSARLMAPFFEAHKLKILDLGAHHKKMMFAYMSLWGGAIGIGGVKSVRDALRETDVSKIQDRTWTVIQSVLDFIALPFDFGLGSDNLVLSIAGSIFNVAAVVSELAYDALSQ